MFGVCRCVCCICNILHCRYPNLFSVLNVLFASEPEDLFPGLGFIKFFCFLLSSLAMTSGFCVEMTFPTLSKDISSGKLYIYLSIDFLLYAQ